ncbi:zinc ribbon domain-containing protein [Nocardioides humilatus]|uniref:Zinc ribbon domain-containing protein n=1 Tax=Nocardioides humilatus TaxID=2607660 RepID=A0A5B1LB25_9ACTN|nr:zinc ribbon domain-containing protein [Nocardioides humilatus]KAA1417941.1 zinc ribbon domain-containing protein [Nocardioides humilatus]
MRYCTNCGHQLGIGRYCTNCGARVPVPPADAPASVEDFPTAVRPGEIPPLHPYGDNPLDTSPPPPLGPAPSTARYPLFADTVSAAEPPAAPPTDPAPFPVVVPTVPLSDGGGGRGRGKGRRAVFPWIFAFLLLAVVAAVGGLLLMIGGSGDEDPSRPDPERTHKVDHKPSETAGSSTPDTEAGPLTPADVDVPDTAPPSLDSDGQEVTFGAGNMLDDDPRTSWRMVGDGTGSVITFTFDSPVTITEVGLINGYAKNDPIHDWYQGNRRITDVTWVFDDGAEVTQELAATRSMQTTPIDGVTTSTIELRLDGVTAPGDGPDARDFTAISDVEIAGQR